MTKRSQVFLLLAALALVFCAGAGVYISSTAESYTFSSETVYGSRESAAGISVERESVLADHAVWTLVWDCGSGEGTSEGRWNLAGCDTFTLSPRPGVFFSFENVDRPWTIDTQQPRGAVERAIASAVLAEYESGGPAETVIDLADYIDTYRTNVSLSQIIDVQSLPPYSSNPFGASFEVSVPAGSYYTVTPYGPDGQLQLLLTEACGAGGAGSDYVFTPEGYMYFSFAVTGADGSHPDGSGLPGGGWSIWRFPCTAYLAPEESGSRWWLSGQFRAGADTGALESVCLLPDGWEDVTLDLSCDGSRLLVFTVGRGAVWLTVLDAASGEQTQLFELFPAAMLGGIGVEPCFDDGAMQCFLTEGRAVFVLGGRAAAALNYADGLYELCFTADALAGADCGVAYGLDCVFDGERMAVLTDCGKVLLLNVFSADGLIYGERLSVPDHFGNLTDATRIRDVP